MTERTELLALADWLAENSEAVRTEFYQTRAVNPEFVEKQNQLWGLLATYPIPEGDPFDVINNRNPSDEYLNALKEMGAAWQAAAQQDTGRAYLDTADDKVLILALPRWMMAVAGVYVPSPDLISNWAAYQWKVKDLIFAVDIVQQTVDEELWQRAQQG